MKLAWRWPCWLRGGHQPLLTQARTPQGALAWPPRRVWTCFRCGRDLGDLVLRLELPPRPGKATEMAYVKLFESILDSTVWLEPDATRIVWITLLAMADRDGVIEASVPGLAKRAGVEREACDVALATFLAPDPDSRTTAHEGRRIVAVPGGWRLLNYDLYREKASADMQRARAAARQQRQRDRHASSRPVTENHPIAEAEAEAEEREGRPSLSQESAREAQPEPKDPEEALRLRAGHLVEHYAELFQKHRNGARYRARPNLDWHEAIDLCRIWDDARLEKLADIVLTTDDPFIESTDRGFKIFAMKASWADDRLTQWELAHGVRA